jgi:hypothetical protein
MRSSQRPSSNSPTAEDLQRMYDHYAAMPVGDPECPACGGSGFFQDEDSSGRCGCMPPLMVVDRETGFPRAGSLLLEGRMDGRPISQEEAEYRHQLGVRMADDTLAEMNRRWPESARPAGSPPQDTDVSSN